MEVNMKTKFYSKGLVMLFVTVLLVLCAGMSVTAKEENGAFALYEDGNMTVLMQDEQSGILCGKLFRDKEYADKELSVTFYIRCTKKLGIYIDVESITEPISVGTVTFQKGKTTVSYSFDVAKLAPKGYTNYYVSFVTSENKQGYVTFSYSERGSVGTSFSIGYPYDEGVFADDEYTNYYFTNRSSYLCSFSRVAEVNLWIASGKQSVDEKNNADHIYTGEWIREILPILYKEGLEFQYCAVCGQKVTRPVPKLDVDIATNKNYGLVHFKVVENRNASHPVPYATIKIITAEQGECTLTTDANGEASAILPIGKNGMTVSKQDYITRTLRFTVSSGEHSLSPIGIGTEKPIELKTTVTAMTLDEIKEVGIDVTVPANQHVYRYEITNLFEPDVPMIPLNIFYNQKGEYIGYGYDNDSYAAEGNFDFERYIPYFVEDGMPKIYIYRDDGRFHDPGYGGIGSGGTGAGSNLKDHTQPDKIIYPLKEGLLLIIDGEAKWLKEMFNVELLIINHSLTDSFENVTAKLNLPDGLSLAAMQNGAGPNEAEQTIEKIDSGSSRTIKWYIRGDKEGEYDLSGVLDGLLMPFEEEYHEELYIEDPIKVYAGSALHMTVYTPAAVYYGEDCTVKIEFENVSDKPIYYFTNRILGLKQCRVTRYSNGEVVETVFLKDNTVTEKFVESFEPGDKLVYEIHTNILFKSEIVLSRMKQLYGQVAGLENLIDYYRALEKTTGDTERMKKMFETLEPVVKQAVNASDSQERVAFEALESAVETVLEKFKTSDITVINILNGLYRAGKYSELSDIAYQKEFLTSDRAQELAEILADIVSRADDPEYDTTKIFAKLRDSILALPMRFVLKDVIVATLAGSTTEIPYSYVVVPDESESYADFVNISANIRNLAEKAAKSLDIPLMVYRRTGILGRIFGDYVFDEKAYFAAKSATGKTQYRVWLEKDGETDTENITLSTEAEGAEFKDGILTFTGSAYVQAEIAKEENYKGVLFVEMADGNENRTERYDFTIVGKHECKAGDAVPVLEKEENYGGFSVRVCDVCKDILDIEWNTPFEDVNQEDWFFDSVKRANVNQYMNGISANEFAPEALLTRGMLVTALHRLEGAPVVSENSGFSDIPEGIWYESAVNWAKKNHIVNGYSKEEFAPEDNISREQIATIMYRYAIYKRYNTDFDRERAGDFSDSAQVSDYAAAAVRYAASCGLMNGKTETEFKPQDEATRAELAAILERFAADNG